MIFHYSIGLMSVDHVQEAGVGAVVIDQEVEATVTEGMQVKIC